MGRNWLGLVDGYCAAAVPPNKVRDNAATALTERKDFIVCTPWLRNIRRLARPSQMFGVPYRSCVSAGLGPDNLGALARSLDSDTRALRPVIDHLVRERRIVRVSSDLYFDRAAVEALREKVVDFLNQHGEIDPGSYKTLTGQSRKHTVPLMEFFDTQKLTIRRDNIRVLRQ